MAAEKSSWLNGPQLAGVGDDDPSRPARWPGEKIGLAQKGPGALASIMRRVVALLIDWVVAMLIALTFSGTSIADFIAPETDAEFINNIARLNQWAMMSFIVVGIVSVAIFARTPGHAMMRMGVARIDQADARVGVWRAVVRTLLTTLVFPPIIVDSDGRGIHDRLTRTAVILG